MGADIHIVIEEHHPEFGWVGIYSDHGPQLKDGAGKYTYAALGERDYAAFAALAGVRGEGPDPKGMPDDASALARLHLVERWGEDAHSHSYCSMRTFVTKKVTIRRLRESWADDDKRDWREEINAALMRTAMAGGITDEEYSEALVQYFAWLDAAEADKMRVVFCFDN